MERERLGRVLSLALLGFGVILGILGIGIGSTPYVGFSVLTMFAGITCYKMADQLFDTDSIEFNPNKTRVLTTNLVQLGLVLLVFALVTYTFSDAELLVASVQNDLQTPVYLVYVGAVIGLLLGGGLAFVTFRWEWLKSASRSVPFRMVGFSTTLCTYFVLLFTNPQAALAYAVIYTLSRLLILFGIRFDYNGKSHFM